MASAEMACSAAYLDDEIFVIHKEYNFSLHVHEQDMTLHFAAGQQRPLKRTIALEVKNSTLQAMKPVPGKRSNSYRGSLFRRHMDQLWDNPKEEAITVASASSMVLIMRVAHETIANADYYVPTPEMWQ